ncbi:hypothetical protein [Amedibacillus hominis]|uniref:Lipoprotein n=1 Tax=Amedibacillus hominis TaxID=2897776 RepID=A0ABS9R223_9FIRM|nr:hypothetical protein [Amedibacillus hominis]MCH4283715.1 hypothetical protein [Amedibacillus hominis]
MKKLKKTTIFVLIPCFMALLSGCQNAKTEETQPPVTFLELNGGIDGHGAIVLEWGEAIPDTEMYHTFRSDVKKEDCKINYTYDENNVGRIIDLNVSVEYKDKKYEHKYTLLIDDTKAPIINYKDKDKIKVEAGKTYDITKDLDIYDMKSKEKIPLVQNKEFNRFYPGYIVTFSNTDLERDYKKAYERTDNQEINTKNLGNHKIIIKASDGHGNVTYKEIDMEVVKGPILND